MELSVLLEKADFLAKGIEAFFVIVLGFVGYLAFKFVIKRLIHSAKSRMSERKVNTLYTVLRSGSKFTIVFLVGVQLISIFGGTTVNSVLTVAGIGGVAIGFGAQSIVKDLLLGLFILLEDQFGVGDFIELEGKSGVVEAIGVRTTRLRSFDGNVHIIPNGEIKIVTNMSKGFNRAVVDVLLTYDTDINKAIEALSDEMQKTQEEQNTIQGLLSVPKVLGITQLGEKFINVRIIADSAIGENWAIEREIRRLVKLRLEKEGIKYPFAQQVIKVESL